MVPLDVGAEFIGPVERLPGFRAQFFNFLYKCHFVKKLVSETWQPSLVGGVLAVVAAVELLDLVAVALPDVADHVGLADGVKVAELALLGRGHLQVHDVDVVRELDAAGGGEGAELAHLVQGSKSLDIIFYRHTSKFWL